MNPELTDEQIRVAIAEACGYSNFTTCDVGLGETLLAWNWPGQEAMAPKEVPKFLESLDAMHEAEKALTEEQRVTYLMRLSQPVPSAMPLDPNYAEEQWLLVTATARQRALAFLATVCAKGE